MSFSKLLATAVVSVHAIVFLGQPILKCVFDPSYFNRLLPIRSPIRRRVLVNEERVACPEGPAAVCASGLHLPGIFLLVVFAAAALEVRLPLAVPRLPALSDAHTRHSGQRSQLLLAGYHAGAVLPEPQHQQELDGLAEVDVISPRKSRVLRRIQETRYGCGREIHEILAKRFHHSNH